MITSCGPGMPSLPPWPFNGQPTMPSAPVGACNMATMPQGSAPTMPQQAPQCAEQQHQHQQVNTYCLPMPAAGTLPAMPSAMPNMMHASTAGGNDTPHPNSIAGMNQMPAQPAWQGQQ